VPREKYKSYNIKPIKDYEFLYWRTEHPIELFMLQLKNNLLKKYMDYFQLNERCTYEDTNSFPLFQSFTFKKQVSTKIVINDSEQIVIGTLWEFGFEGWGNNKLIQFALDVGLGERNSMGFGFMNVRTKK
jgi:CRISPR-associated endoribonuclease Cas6